MKDPIQLWRPKRTSPIWKEINEMPMNPTRFVGSVYKSEIGFDY